MPAPNEIPTITNKQRAFVEEYLTCFNATEAARRANYAHPNTQGPRLLVNVGIRAVIDRRMGELVMSANEVLARLDQQARGSLADVITFRTVRTRTTILKPAQAVIDELRAQIAFEEEFAARVALSGDDLEAHNADMARIWRRILRLELELEYDPAALAEGNGPIVEEQVPTVDLAHATRQDKMHILKSYNGEQNKVELYSAQAALELLGKHQKLFTDSVEITGKDGGDIPIKVLRGVSMDEV